MIGENFTSNVETRSDLIAKMTATLCRAPFQQWPHFPAEV